MKEQEKADCQLNHEHILSMVKEEDGSYYPGCAHCDAFAKVPRRNKVKFIEQAKDSPAG